MRRAERLAFWNCFMDREAWDAIFVEQTGERKLVNRETGEVDQMSQEDFDDLTTLHVCDWLEQVPRSQEWDYRREAYRGMANHSGGIAVSGVRASFCAGNGQSRRLTLTCQLTMNADYFGDSNLWLES